MQAEYFMNKSYIARVLCVNKNKPKMHCNGKCYLARKLKEEEKQEQQAPVPKKEKFEVQPYFLPTQLSFVNVHTTTELNYCYTEKLDPSFFFSSVFHPPSA